MAGTGLAVRLAVWGESAGDWAFSGYCASLTACPEKAQQRTRWSQLSAGFKFNAWELRGAPLRLELGPRDLSAGVVTLASRLGGDKEQLPLESVAASIPRLLEQFQAIHLGAPIRQFEPCTGRAWPCLIRARASRPGSGGDGGFTTVPALG